jgi:hypothetical protein
VRRKRGTPIGGETAVRLRLKEGDKQRLIDHAATETRSVSDLLREVIAAAARATPKLTQSGELGETNSTVRLDPETVRALQNASDAAHLEPTVWLRLLVTDTGRVLLRHLEAAQKRLGERKPRK